MKAVFHPVGDGPDALQLREMAAPQASANDVLIDVSVAGVNYSDLIGLSTGNNFLGATPDDRIPGGEVAGRRVDNGKRVVAICGAGGYAQQVVAPADQVFEIPDDVSDEAAVALFIQGLTAWYMLSHLGRLTEGQSVLVHSGAGGVGLLALQIAKALGAGSIVATASSDGKRALTLANGATAAVDSNRNDAVAAAVEANGGRPFDLVLDRSGGDIFAQSIEVTAPLGRVVCYGASSGEPAMVSAQLLLRGSRTVSGIWLMDFLRDPAMAKQGFDNLFALHRAGKLDAKIGLQLPLDQAGDALKAIASRATSGKVLLDARSV